MHHFQNGETGKESEEDKDANKSEISVVFEIALKRNIPVTFEVCITCLPVLHIYLTKKVLKKGTTKIQHIIFIYEKYAFHIHGNYKKIVSVSESMTITFYC